MSPDSRALSGQPETSQGPTPCEDDAALDAPRFYRLDGAKVTYREIRWEAPALFAPLAWLILKIGGTRIPATTDDVPVESLDAFECLENEVPGDARERLRGPAQELAMLGFHSPVYHVVKDPLHRTQTTLVTFAHRSLPVMARLHERAWAIKAPPKIKQFTEFITMFTDGGCFWSLSGKADMLAPESCRVVRRERASAAELLRGHQEALAAEPASRRRMPAANADQAVDLGNLLHERVRDFHVARGVFAPLKGAEATLQATPSAAQAGGGVSAYPEVMVELEKIQNKKTGWMGAIVLLAVSIAFFVMIGFQGQSLLRVLALVPILLVHETGHLLSMKAFGYRNLRMFFIPGFGAAVSGQHFNVAGWKKVVVSLMGPVPSIVLGVIVGLVGVVAGSDLVLEAAMLTLILNGLNLLPILPLDGGHVVHTVIFSRSPALDIVFRALAALAIGGLGIALGSKLFLFLSVFMFLGIGHVARVGRAARELRAEGLIAASPDSRHIPPEVAERIIAKIVAADKKPQPAKLTAARTLQVFETLNTRPPGVAASIALLGLHALSLAAALVFCVVFVFAQQGSLQQFLSAAANRPAHAIEAPVAPARPAPPSAGTYATILATFPDHEQAAAAYQDAAARVQGDERVTLFADTLFVQVPSSDEAARMRWLGVLEPAGADAFVDSTAMRAHFRFQALARNAEEAESIAADLRRYFSLPLDAGLVAPWSPVATPTPEQAAARETYSRLGDATYGVWEDPEMEALQAKMKRAVRSGAEAEHKALLEQEEILTRTLILKRIKTVANEPGMDAALAERYLELFETADPADFHQIAGQELAPILGLASEAGNDATHARWGHAWRTGLVVEISYVTFAESAAGASALVDWLESRGCRSLRYDVYGEEQYLEEIEPSESPG